MERWALYYDDGRIVTDADCAWDDAPLDGVLFVLSKRGDRVTPQSGADFYYPEDDLVVATSDLNPLLRKLKFIKFGRWTSISKYEAIGKRVAEDAKSWQR
jgi:hypothetical protein